MADPATWRYNNPGAQYPNSRSRVFGSDGYGIIGGGHKIARFPDDISGAAANMDLLLRKYSGLTVAQAIKKWSGGNNTASYIKGLQQLGFDPNAKITDELVRNPQFAISLFKGIAQHEAGRAPRMSDQDWQEAHSRFLKANPTMEEQIVQQATAAEAPMQYAPTEEDIPDNPLIQMASVKVTPKTPKARTPKMKADPARDAEDAARASDDGMPEPPVREAPKVEEPAADPAVKAVEDAMKPASATPKAGPSRMVMPAVAGGAAALPLSTDIFNYNNAGNPPPQTFEPGPTGNPATVRTGPSQQQIEQQIMQQYLESIGGGSEEKTEPVDNPQEEAAEAAPSPVNVPMPQQRPDIPSAVVDNPMQPQMGPTYYQQLASQQGYTGDSGEMLRAVLRDSAGQSLFGDLFGG